MLRGTTCGLAVIGCLLLQQTLFAQTIITESFETDPGTTYTLSNQFDDGSFDFFDRYMVPEPIGGNAARDDFQNGWNGDWGILGQDHDGDGFAATQSIFINGIDISGFTNLVTRVSLGALNSEPDFNNYEAADGDGIRIFASIDSASFVLIGEFAPNATGESDLYLDTDGDGIGDGPNLTVDLTDFTFALGGVGSLLDLRIDLTSTASFEPLAVDNVRVINIPEPGTGAILALGLAAGLIRRRR